MPNRPIVLVGMPRSGTSWLGKIFDSHPDTLYRHEPDSSQRITGVPLFADVTHSDQYEEAITSLVNRLPGAWHSHVAATLPIFAKSYYAHSRFVLRKFSIVATKLGARLFGEMPVPEMIDLKNVAQLRLVWKSIESVGRLGVVCRSLPAARAALILRHPCGYVASVLRGESLGKFSSATPSHEDFGVYAQMMKIPEAAAHGLTLEMIKDMPAVERLAWRWVLFNEKAINDVSGLTNCSCVSYEEFCSDPMANSRKLFDFCGLGWNGQTEAFIRQSTESEKSSYYSIFKDPLKSANKWKTELAARDIDRVLAVTRDTKPGRLVANCA